MKKRIKVAILGDSLPGSPEGGIATFLFNLINNFNNKEINWTLFVPEHIRLWNTPKILNLYPEFQYPILRKLNTFDVVHINWGVFNSNNMWLFDILQDVKKPIIYTCHSLQYHELLYFDIMVQNYESELPPGLQYSKQLLKTSANAQLSLMQKAKKVVFVSKMDRAIFNQGLNKVNPNTLVIYNGVPFNNIDIDNIKQSKELGFYGRLNYRKGILNSMAVMDLLPEYNLTIHGTNDAFTSTLMERFNYLSNIYREGFLETDIEKKEFFQKISLLLANSYYEPFGFSHLESMFHGVFPIIGEGTGTVEIFGNDYPFKVAAHDVVGLKNVIENYNDWSLDDLKELAVSLNESLKKFDVETFAGNYERLYKETK